MTLNEVLKNTNYDVSLFSEEARKYVEDAIVVKTIRGKESLFIKCLKRDKEIALKPEEAVRQLYLYKLIHEYGYPTSRIEVEFPIHFGREVKRADIAIMDKDRLMVPYIIVELKKPKLTDGKEQLKSYCNATGAPIGVWTNGEQISYYNRKDPNYFEPITNIPKVSEKLADIINEKFTYEDLKKIDRISQQKRSLRSLIQEMEDEVLASAGVDSFEEIFKLIFAKLYDELVCERDAGAYLKFRNAGETDFELKEKIQGLFDDAKKKWEGIFTDESKILLSPSHLAVCVATLQDIKLFNNNLDVVDDAFEYLMSKAQKGEKGQYFTPRYVIDMCVKMMNPTVNDKIIDTACGSSGFTVHSIFKVWKDIRREKGLPEDEGFTAAQRIPEETNFVRDNVFAIDFDEKTVRVARTLNLIAGDGQTNVLHLNTLDYARWNEIIKQEDWNDTYNEGFKKLKKLQPKGSSDYSQFQFDLVMANPPFAGDIKENTIISRYELGKKSNGKWQNKLFIAKPDGSPQRRDRMSANFGQLIRHLEMPHIRFHDLRHTAATNMHQLTGDFYTVGEILGHTLKGIGISLGISTNLEAVTAQYVDVRLERKQSVLQTYHKALQPKTTVTGKEAGQETSKKAKKKSNEMEL